MAENPVGGFSQEDSTKWTETLEVEIAELTGSVLRSRKAIPYFA